MSDEKGRCDVLTVEDVHGRIKGLAKDRDLSIYELARRAGMAESTLYNLFERGTMPKIDTLSRLCDAMEITMSDFFVFAGEPGENRYMTEDEIALLEINRELTRRNREHLMIYAQGMIDSQQPRALDKKRI